MREGSVARVRATAAAVGLGLILVGGFQFFYLEVYTADRSAMRRWMTELPLRKTPGLRAFLEEARGHTAPGDVIAFVVPYSEWEGGYRYSMRGAQYILAGRTVRPLVGPGDVDLSANLADANVVVAWNAEVPRGFEVVWKAREGAVARRPR